MHTLEFDPGPLCPTYLRPSGGLPLKRPYNLRGSLSAWRVACGRLLPLWTPRGVRQWSPGRIRLAWSRPVKRDAGMEVGMQGMSYCSRGVESGSGFKPRDQGKKSGSESNLNYIH
jgi:hypothetical protein